MIAIMYLRLGSVIATTGAQIWPNKIRSFETAMYK